MAFTPPLTIKDLPQAERPRERLMKYGPRALSTAELLAIILRSGSPRENVIELSQRLLKESSIKSLSRKKVNTLKTMVGIGDAKACQISACFELGRRLTSFKDQRRPMIHTARDIIKLYQAELQYLKKEHFKGIFLDARKRVIKDETIFIGTLNASLIHPREIFQAAVEEGAAAIIVLHNHPSGNPQPSDDDIEITRQLIKAGSLLDIPILDHIIVGDKNYFSFKEKGYF